MSRRTVDRDQLALQHLDRLAGELRRLGLGTELEQGRQPFPGLVVRASTVSAVILAGSAHFWRHAPEGDLQLIGPLEGPAATARAVHKHLTDKQRRAHERAKR